MKGKQKEKPVQKEWAPKLKRERNKARVTALKEKANLGRCATCGHPSSQIRKSTVREIAGVTAKEVKLCRRCSR